MWSGQSTSKGGPVSNTQGRTVGLGLQRVRVSSQGCLGNKTELHGRQTSRMEAGLRDFSMPPDTAGYRDELFTELGAWAAVATLRCMETSKDPNKKLA